LGVKADILILDGRHLLWRTNDAFGMLSAELGDVEVATGGIYGFLSVAIRIHQRYGGRVIVAWEGRNNFRYKLYPEYKKKSEPDEERLGFLQEMSDQELRLKSILRAIGVEQYKGIRCEADDVIGRLAHRYAAAERRVVVYTGDSDLRQLVGDFVTVVAPGRRGNDAVFDSEEAVREKHEVSPPRLADLKALAGDGSDNIPGIKGVGPKTAAKLINAYGDVEDVIHAAKINEAAKPPWPVAERFREPIAEAEDDIRLFKELTFIDGKREMALIAPNRNKKRLIRQLVLYKFRSLMAPAELNELMKMA
jgi:DNA polymerase-1